MAASFGPLKFYVAPVVGCIYATMTQMTADSLRYDVDADADWIDDLPRPFTISFDGTRLYASRTPFPTSTSEIVQYNMSTPFDASTMSKAGFIDVSAQYPGSSSPVMGQIRFSQDGLTCFTWDQNTNEVFVYSLSTAWEITTASLWYSTDWDTFLAGSKIIRGFAIDAAGTSAIIHDRLGQLMHNLTLSTPFDLRTLTVSSTKDVSLITELGSATDFQCDGSAAADITCGASTWQVKIFTLSTPWDVNSIAFDRTLSGSQSVFLRSMFDYSASDNRVIGLGSDSRSAPTGRSFESFTLS